MAEYRVEVELADGTRETPYVAGVTTYVTAETAAERIAAAGYWTQAEPHTFVPPSQIRRVRVVEAGAAEA